MEGLTASALRAPAVSFAVAALLSVLAVIGLTRLGFDDGLRSAFRSQSEEYRLFERTREAFASPESDILVLFSGDDLAGAETLEAIRGFVIDTAFIDGVDHALSAFSLRLAVPGSPSTTPLFPADLSARVDLDALLARAREHPLGGSRFISEDHRRMVVIVALDRDVTELAQASRIRAAIEAEAERAMTDAEADIDIAVTGMLPVREAVISGLLRDQVTLNLLGAVAGLIMCIVVFGSFTLALLTGLPAVIALLWVLGALGLIGVNVNTVTNALPVLILVLAFADSMHLSFELCRQTEAGRNPRQALDATLRRIGPACALTSITTGVAFAALLLSSSELVRSLGQGGVIAVSVSLLAVLIAHPLLFLAGFRSGLIKPERITRPRLFDRRGEGFTGIARFATARPFAIAATGVIALLISTIGYTTIKPVYSFLENLESSQSVVRALDRIERSTGPALSIDIPVAMTVDDDGRLEPASLARLGRIHNAVAAIADGRPVLSAWSLAQWLMRDGDGDAAMRTVALLDDMGPGLRSRLLSDDGTLALIRVMTDDGGSQQIRALSERIERAASTAAGEPVRATGLLAISARVSADMISHLNISFLAAVGASGLLMMVWFRNVAYGLIGLIPNVIPIALVGAWLALSGRGLQFTSALALTIAFGIAVDDTVHFFNRLRLEAPRGRGLDGDAIHRALVATAPVLIATTLVLCIGMASTLASEMPMIRYFGELAIAVFIIALIADLVILPACLTAAGRIIDRGPDKT